MNINMFFTCRIKLHIEEIRTFSCTCHEKGTLVTLIPLASLGNNVLGSLFRGA